MKRTQLLLCLLAGSGHRSYAQASAETAWLNQHLHPLATVAPLAPKLT